jgi:hypothetical protein
MMIDPIESVMINYENSPGLQRVMENAYMNFTLGRVCGFVFCCNDNKEVPDNEG